VSGFSTPLLRASSANAAAAFFSSHSRTSSMSETATPTPENQPTQAVRILPTVGRVVWFWPNHKSPRPAFEAAPDQPCAATVAYVHSPTCVNLSVTDHSGNTHAITSVPLIHPDEPKPDGVHCTWMPFQLGQAKAAS
jgi:hypothetical protein